MRGGGGDGGFITPNGSSYFAGFISVLKVLKSPMSVCMPDKEFGKVRLLSFITVCSIHCRRSVASRSYSSFWASMSTIIPIICVHQGGLQ